MKLLFTLFHAILVEVTHRSYLATGETLFKRAINNIHLDNIIPGRTIVSYVLPFYDLLLENSTYVAIVLDTWIGI